MHDLSYGFGFDGHNDAAASDKTALADFASTRYKYER